MRFIRQFSNLKFEIYPCCLPIEVARVGKAVQVRHCPATVMRNEADKQKSLPRARREGVGVGAVVSYRLPVVSKNQPNSRLLVTGNR